MQGTGAPSPVAARLAWAATFVALILSVVLLVAREDHTFAAIGLVVALCLAGMFVVMELRFAWALGRFQAPAAVTHEGAAEGFLGSLLDPETGLPRFWLFLARLADEVERARRHNRELTLCALEPDGFEAYLDGAFRGKVGHAVRGHLRTGDSATVDPSGRLLVLFAETAGSTGEKAARRLVKRLNSALFQGEAHTWRASMIVYPQDAASAEELMQRLQELLAKRRAA